MGCSQLEAFVEEMATGGRPPTAVRVGEIQEDVLKLRNAVKSQPEVRRIASRLYAMVWSDLPARARRRRLIALHLVWHAGESGSVRVFE